MVLVPGLRLRAPCSRLLLEVARDEEPDPGHMSAMRTMPPTNSASVNSQPRKIQITMPSSKTRFVDANWNAIADTKLAPFWNSDFAIATAA